MSIRDNPPGVAAPIGLYSHMARTTGLGQLLFIAGQVSVDPAGNVVGEDDFPAQVWQVFKNFGTILAACDSGWESVLKLTTYLVSVDTIDVFYQAREELFASLYPEGGYPPNTLLVVDRLVRPEFRVEIEGVVELP